MHRYSLIKGTTITLGLIACVWIAAGWAHQAVAPRTTPLAEPDPMADGPHVMWLADSIPGKYAGAAVWYFCEGWDTNELIEFEDNDTIWFTGTCNDFGRRYRVVAEPPQVPPVRVEGVSRILAVSDIHGEYDAFKSFIQTAGVIDDKLHWQWGDGHLVIDGDVFDRGDKVTECLWLIHQLEAQAREAGGAVHMLLGNHETIVMRGDERYVNQKYLDGIVAFLASRGDTGFRYKDLFTAHDELGRWLRSRNTAIIIDSTLFVHGGLAPEVMHRRLSLDTINAAVREGIAYLRGDTSMPQLPEFIHGTLGPLWYRGWQYGLEDRYPEISDTQLDSVLAYYGATAAVAGHSEIDSVLSMHNSRVYFIDIPVDERGGFEGLLRENGAFYRIRTDGSRVQMK